MRTERFDFIYLPEKYHSAHQDCEFLLQQIEDFVSKEEFGALKTQTIRFDEEPVLLDGEHIFDYLDRIGMQGQHEKIIKNAILRGMATDSVHFLQLAFHASIQRRLTVTFALIRKPFCYNLLVILRTFLTSDFFQQFKTTEDFDTTKLSPDDKKLLLRTSGSVISTPLDTNVLYEIIFDTTSPDSIINLSNRALHPSTTQNKVNLTGKKNLNFVFSNEENIDSQWDYLYKKLPFLLLYLNELIECFVFGTNELDDKLRLDRREERAEYLTRNK
ncbi:MAG: hypothetical protein EOP48_34375 [Sphingobacteriales bacterium]|nr:MAG: hypothetical protein EOP48_34375 [Sphingobacteriales bacterium]